MALAEEENLLTHLWLPGQGYPRIAPHETELLAEGKRQLLEYLTGLRREFSLPLGPRGTPFQMEVWRALEARPPTATPCPSLSPASGWWGPAGPSPATAGGWS